MDENMIFKAMPDDLNPGDVIKVDGELHQITGPAEDDGDMITYTTINLDGGDDDVVLDPDDGAVDVYDVS